MDDPSHMREIADTLAGRAAENHEPLPKKERMKITRGAMPATSPK